MDTFHSVSVFFETLVGELRYTVGQLFVSLPTIDRFSKFFRWCTQRTICNNVTIVYP